MICTIQVGFATNQVGDILIYNNDTFRLHHTPFSLYEDKLNALREDKSTASNCRRGYQGEWIIKDGLFYLSNLYHCGSISKTYNWNDLVEKVLGKKFENGLIHADWVSGDFWAGKGYVRAGNHSDAWKKEVHFYLKYGKVDSVQTYLPVSHPKTEGANLYKVCYAGIGKAQLKKLMEDDVSIYGKVLLRLNSAGKVISFKLVESDHLNISFQNLIKAMARKIKYYTLYRNNGYLVKDIEIDLTITPDRVKKYLENN